MKDNRNNVVEVTQFESLLSHYVLTHPALYEPLYLKVIDALDAFIKKNRSDERGDRQVFAIFSIVNDAYPGFNSVDAIKRTFYLPAAEAFIKYCCDTILTYKETDVLERKHPPSTLAGLAYEALYSGNAKRGFLKVSSHIRASSFFEGANRGVVEVESPPRRMTRAESDFDLETRDLGISEYQYTLPVLRDFFTKPISRVRAQYLTHEDSPIAKRLRAYHLPVIAGASGSTEALLSKVMPILDLSPDEVRLLLFVQSMNMVAHGFHSYFECMFTAERLGFTVEHQDSLRALYLQTFPKAFLEDPDFMAYFDSLPLQRLIDDIRPERISIRPMG